MLRDPLSRVVADWLHCENEYLREGSLSHGETLCSHGAKAPPAGTRLMSNESFAWFVNQHADGPSSEHEGWDNGFRTANLQVGMLASVPKGQPVTREHLKKAKRILGAEKGPVRWVVGTTDTMHEFYLELAARAGNIVPTHRALARQGAGHPLDPLPSRGPPGPRLHPAPFSSPRPHRPSRPHQELSTGAAA